jgi:hypothetical protein
VTRSAETTVELSFLLEVDDDGWPPVAVEWLWCRKEGKLYRVLTCPLFVRGLSAGDVISVALNDKDQVESFDVEDPSDRSTIWLIAQDQDVREDVLSRLRALGCNTARGTQAFLSLSSVDVPGALDIAAVDEVLGPLERTGQISVAYPSFRHEEPRDGANAQGEPNG